MTKLNGKVKLTEKEVNHLIQRFKNIFLTKDEFEGFKFELDGKLKDHRSDLLNTLDKILKEVVAGRQEQKIIGHKIIDHGERIEKLEEIHSGNRHLQQG